MQPVQFKMARAALDLSVDQLAAKAGVSHVEIARLEDGTDGTGEVTERVRAIFETAGIQWIDDDGVRFTGPPNDETIALDALSSANDE